MRICDHAAHFPDHRVEKIDSAADPIVLPHWNRTQDRRFQDFGSVVVILGRIDDCWRAARSGLPPETLGQDPVHASRGVRGVVSHTRQGGCDFRGLGHRRR